MSQHPVFCSQHPYLGKIICSRYGSVKGKCMPTPATDIIIISDVSSDDYTVKLYNSAGNCVLEQPMAKQICVGLLPKAIYTLEEK